MLTSLTLNLAWEQNLGNLTSTTTELTKLKLLFEFYKNDYRQSDYVDLDSLIADLANVRWTLNHLSIRDFIANGLVDLMAYF